MRIFLTGLNHKVANLEVRERAHIPQDRAPEVLQALRSSSHIAGAAILSTCNRTELYVSARDRSAAQLAVEGCLREVHASTYRHYSDYLYAKEHVDAARHMFRVASGLDSMMLGEAQILGQVRSALRQSESAGSLDHLLALTMRYAISTARRVRNETSIGRLAVSMSQAAVECARDVLGDLTGIGVLVIGAGKMSEHTARMLRRAHAGQLYVSSRTYERANRLALSYQGEAVPFTDLDRIMPAVDLMLQSSTAPYYLVTVSQMVRYMALRGQRPLVCFDLAVPRDVEPSSAELPGVHLYNIDDLQAVARQNQDVRMAQVPVALGIVDQELERWKVDAQHRNAKPTIARLVLRSEQLRQREVAKLSSKLGGLDPRAADAIAQMTSSLVSQLLHEPISYLRRNPRDREAAQQVERLFKLDDTSTPPSEWRQ